MKKKIISLLLAAVMLFTVEGTPTLAKSVTGGNKTESADTFSPARPVHHCTKKDDGSDYTDWSYVYFGSYPQTEVAGDILTDAITKADYDATGDAWVNGTKYRRITRNDTNSPRLFGNSEYRYFKWERIKWRVLENNGGMLFIVADQGLDSKEYNKTTGSVTWETCTLRTWMNETFYDMAFSSREQGAVVQHTVVNHNNPLYGTKGGNGTQDKVYLLSVDEATTPEYGFCESGNCYSASRWMQASDYACVLGVSIYQSYDIGVPDTSAWWLRSPGNSASRATYGESGGGVFNAGDYVSNYNYACVPALHINLSSDLWYMTDDGSSGEGGEDLELGSEKILTEIKNRTKKELESYKNAEDYREAQKEALAEAVDAGKDAIDAAEDEEGVNSALETAKAAIDQIKTDEQLTKEELTAGELQKVKENSKKELEGYKDVTAYREEQKVTLAEAIAKGKDAIDEAADKESVYNALKSAKVAIDQIKTDEQLTKEEEELTAGELQKVKENRKKELEGYKNAEDYREEQKIELAEAVVAGKEAIDMAADEEGVNSALESAKAAIDQIKTNEQMTKEEEELTASELQKVKENSKKELEGYKNIADYREAQIEELAAAIANGKEAIDAAADEEGVQSALAAAKSAIDRIKTNEQLVLEEQNSEGAGQDSGTDNGLNQGNTAVSADSSNASDYTDPFNINPSSIKGKIKAEVKGFTIKWEKAASVTGYQIQYSTSRKFKKKNTKTKTVKKASKKKLTIKKLKAEKKYYVRIRTFKTVGRKKYYSVWSKAKSVKTKK